MERLNDIRDIKMNVATLCAYTGMSTQELSIAAEIKPTHLMAVRAGRARITGDDLLGLSAVSGIPVENIETDPAKQ
ncbi:MAG: hypothetical protein IJV14_14535 [Lachnospiraceae bacterium]|nr:hypothetical protein [Lachnospiraceae bacterium]